MNVETGMGRGELLREEITNDKPGANRVYCPRAQNRGPEAPERGFTMSDRELLEKLRCLSPANQDLAIEILTELLISQQTSSCSPVLTDESCP